mmetsp:Transcript_29270/g.43418  ORF Transcript_29270/g.43418 Transcript_29270/m.43418 type:complete len:232 (+) Transcript_29270:95-790(+)|eukprot:CAMPEP_0195529874 /NCGR_PEP_ID=MMETSP0794_2-20130614/32516_1 /TAXON_ID=515487 /ORGANISM="Stephanopyxis turris, Strain CCMP 815" /LENGTH=231 /DNA_ID=CAMNT_0040661249 /DNA_START=80 /DNA_END=775 /DNA_ORIENTATION=+
MNWFGKKKTSASDSKPKPASSTKASSTASNATNTIVSLRENIENQEKREAHIQKKIDSMVAEAKAKMAAKDKKGALFAMKRKKMYETEIDKIQSTKMTLETQVMALESATQNMQTFNAMKSGSNAMKKIRNDVDIDKVDDMMDDIKEEMDMANEISNAIAQPVDPYAYGDEDDLLNELAELEMEDTEAELLKPVEDINLPAVPGKKLPKPNKEQMDEEAALKQLEAELAAV